MLPFRKLHATSTIFTSLVTAMHRHGKLDTDLSRLIIYVFISSIGGGYVDGSSFVITTARSNHHNVGSLAEG